jgi:hypothetical protein
MRVKSRNRVNYTGIKLKDMTRKQLRAYRREYYRTHREQCKKNLYNYRKKHPERIREIQKRCADKHRELCRAYSKKYYRAHKEYFVQWKKQHKNRR